MGCCNRRCGICTTFFLSILFVTLGLVIALFWGSLYNKIVTRELMLTNSSQSYNLWKETPIPMYLSVYLFNWTNADEVLKSKWAVKPNFEQCGPYVFSEHHVRVNVTWNENGTVTYQQKRTWYFLPPLSNGTLNDEITNLNPILAVVENKVKNLNFIERKLVNLVLKGLEKNLIITKTVDELLFKGFTDSILEILSKAKIPGINIPFNKFGWFYGRNESATYDGTFTMYTGSSDIEELGLMELWNGAPYTKDYDGYCGLVNGTSGELWPPVKNYQRVSIFSSDICSSLPFDYDSEETVLEVTGRKFIGSDFAFDNGTKYPEQACFSGDKVAPSGVRNISKCKFDAPAYISYPHFYLADPSYLENVTGLHPNETDHQMYMILEPNSGMPLKARAQLQLNLFMEEIPAMSMFANIPPIYMPMLWFRQEATITKKYTDMVEVLLDLRNLGLYIGWSAFGFGILLGIASILLAVRKNPNNKELEHLLENEQDQTR